MTGLDARISSTVLGTPDPARLAAFYLGLFPAWETLADEPEWVQLKPPGGGHGLAFQLEEHHAHPAWPAGPGEQQMQIHLDIGVGDLEAAVVEVERLGASLAAYQPQDDVRVVIDPDGHPFCLFQRG